MDFSVRMLAFIESVKSKAKDGLSFEEAYQILIEFMEVAVEAASELSNPGVDKRAIVLEWAGKLFDVLAPAVALTLPLWYQPLVPFLRPLNRYLFLAAAGAILEYVYKKANQ